MRPATRNKRYGIAVVVRALRDCISKCGRLAAGRGILVRRCAQRRSAAGLVVPLSAAVAAVPGGSVLTSASSLSSAHPSKGGRPAASA
ncbi:hypothetical protein [Edaphovirga cremea]|uniref:hypothetical protein n=1 Tax=Edaphovirga cremea TaxID=2267246 RepID=UPI0013008B6B|nr:hypothetical protein [Edaphovirga cremea]